MKSKTTKRKFARVPKTKSGVPLKYLAGLTGGEEKEKRTRNLESS